MKNRDKSNKRLVELLWIEINRAIISSDNVKATLDNLRQLNLLQEIKKYNLVLDINKLIELTSIENTDIDPRNKMEGIMESGMENFGFKKRARFSECKDDGESRPDPLTKAEGLKNRQYIDGKPLSKNQVLFQEYLERRFDNTVWLKKARISF